MVIILERKIIENKFEIKKELFNLRNKQTSALWLILMFNTYNIFFISTYKYWLLKRHWFKIISVHNMVTVSEDISASCCSGYGHPCGVYWNASCASSSPWRNNHHGKNITLHSGSSLGVGIPPRWKSAREEKCMRAARAYVQSRLRNTVADLKRRPKEYDIPRSRVLKVPSSWTCWNQRVT